MNARALYEALLDTDGPYEDVIDPWLAQASAADYRVRLHVAATPHNHWWTDKKEDGWNLLQELYALSRVSDYLLLRPHLDSYLRLFTALGMTAFDQTPFDQTSFDPFLHEITEVEQAEDPDSPIEILDVRRPGLMLGELLFSRAGVRIRAGITHAERGVADHWPLYWTHRRAHRPTRDLSQGWGSNSQWRTDFRLDYRTPAGDLLNLAEAAPIDGDPDRDPDDYGNLGPDERLLTPAERRELLRHRTFLRTPATAAASPTWAADLFPFEWRLPADHG
ncbi:hypothetical protein [Streptomyces sp. CBMA123]|uniref:hypothetical protein n=1 Tax=Streptomyces sp. CBMA123 TaxID=1896313 RepID=UPI001661C541|nr:hypothetical protein [Streptomyces sp. CBMA123]MBD0696061.1 hypothetical protein [Streptomyces sp. CBMA123]